jgi:hypothetical protein
MQPIEGPAGSADVGSAAVSEPTPPTTPPETGSATAPIADIGSAKEPAAGSGKRDPKRDPKRDGKRPKQVAEGSAAKPPPDVVKVVPPGGGSGSATTAVKPAGPPTASEVYKQYAKVGAELKALQQSKGDDAVTDLWSRYRLIQIQQATASEANRVQAITLLSSISKTAASRR